MQLGLVTCDQSQHSLGRSIILVFLLLGSKCYLKRKPSRFSTQTWTCWEFAPCICVFSRSHSLLMANLLVRYLLKSYILIRVCFISLMLLILGSSKCHDGEAWQNIALKIYFRFSQVLYEWLVVFIVANGARFSHQFSIGMRPTVWNQKTWVICHWGSFFRIVLAISRSCFSKDDQETKKIVNTHGVTHRSVHEIFYFATLSLPSLS